LFMQHQRERGLAAFVYLVAGGTFGIGFFDKL